MKGFILWALTIAMLYIAVTAGTMKEWGMCALFAGLSAALLYAAPTPGGSGGTKPRRRRGGGGGNSSLASLMQNNH